MIEPIHPLLTLSLTELVSELHAKRATALSLMEATLARAEETAWLNALVLQRDRDALLSDAREADARLAAGAGRALEGVPLVVKDLEDAAGLWTSHGSKLFEGEGRATRDSTQVARLRATGAIVVGKSNTPELGSTAITKNLVYGVTASPWDRARSPGGSSGGAAALVAAEVTPLVTASDGGGSIRIPASFTGCFGLKPSHGRVPRGPMSHWDYGATSVYGPLTKTVEDAALVLDVVVGAHAADPRSLPHPGHRYVDRLRDAPPAGLRIALSLDLGYGAVQADVARAVEEAALALSARVGATMTRIAGGPPEMGAEWGLLNAYELGAELGERLEGREAEVSRSLMDGLRMARGVTQSWWGRTARRRAEVVAWCAALFADHDVLITPTTPFTAPPAKGPFPREIDGNPLPMSSAGTFTIPFNLSWHPAASVRAGLSDAGLPIGMQIVVPHHRDDLALMLSLAFERERPWHPAWPLR